MQTPRNKGVSLNSIREKKYAYVSKQESSRWRDTKTSVKIKKTGKCQPITRGSSVWVESVFE